MKSSLADSLKEILAKPHDFWLEWVEPVPGLDAELKEVTVTEVNRMTAHDCMAVERRKYVQGQVQLVSDEDLLLDFIAVHWATIAPKPVERLQYAVYTESSKGIAFEYGTRTDKAEGIKLLRKRLDDCPHRQAWLCERRIQTEEHEIQIEEHGQTKLEAPGTPAAPQPGSAETDRTVPANVGVDPARVQSVSESVVVLRPGVLPPGHAARAYPLADGTDAHGIPSHAPADGG